MVSVSLYLCISVSLSRCQVIRSRLRVDLIFIFYFVFEDWSYDFEILTFWIERICWCKQWRLKVLSVNFKLKFELKKGHFWNFNIIPTLNFGLIFLLIWPWIIGFQVSKHETVCSHILQLVRHISDHIFANCAWICSKAYIFVSKNIIKR